MKKLIQQLKADAEADLNDAVNRARYELTLVAEEYGLDPLGLAKLIVGGRIASIRAACLKALSSNREQALLNAYNNTQDEMDLELEPEERTERFKAKRANDEEQVAS